MEQRTTGISLELEVDPSEVLIYENESFYMRDSDIGCDFGQCPNPNTSTDTDGPWTRRGWQCDSG